MDEKERTIKHLQLLKDRYFRPVIARREGVLNHFAPCAVFRAVEVYGYAPCTCGFNYDLRELPGRMAEKINPKIHEEYRNQECPNEPLPTKEGIAERKRFLEKAFGPIVEAYS